MAGRASCQTGAQRLGQRALLPQKNGGEGGAPDDIKSSDDLYKLPFLSKADLRDAYPYGLMARPLKDCVRIQSTSDGESAERVPEGMCLAGGCL